MANLVSTKDEYIINFEANPPRGGILASAMIPIRSITKDAGVLYISPPSSLNLLLPV